MLLWVWKFVCLNPFLSFIGRKTTVPTSYLIIKKKLNSLHTNLIRVFLPQKENSLHIIDSYAKQYINQRYLRLRDTATLLFRQSECDKRSGSAMKITPRSSPHLDTGHCVTSVWQLRDTTRWSGGWKTRKYDHICFRFAC